MVVQRLRELAELARSRTSRGFRLVVPWLLGLFVIQALLTVSLLIVGWDDTAWLVGILTGRGLLAIGVVALVFIVVRLCLRRFQFRLRTLLLTMTALSVLLALCGAELLNSRKELQAAAEIQSVGGHVFFGESTESIGLVLRWLTGEDVLAPPRQVTFDNDAGLRDEWHCLLCSKELGCTPFFDGRAP